MCFSALRHRGRPDVLWRRHGRAAPAGGILRRSHPARCQSGRSFSAGADQIRNGPQLENGEGARLRRAADAPGPRRRGDRMNKRDFITLLGGAAAAWPLAARAQQAGKTPRVGYIRAGAPRNDPFREEFVRGMRDLGYVEGRNIAYEFRHYGDDVESIPSLIGDLLRAKVDIIVVGGTAAIRAAQRATQSIPIVMGAAGEPLESGWIAGLARPGGNITGLSVMSTELVGKRLEILKQVMTNAARIAILQQPANPAHSLFIKEVEL